jgi:hypothetical protein
MNTTSTADKADSTAVAKQRLLSKNAGKGAGKTTGGSELGRDASREAKRLAAAILEVLAGVRTPPDAARTMEMSLPRYYVLEQRALQGLLSACEAKPKGRVRSPASEVTALRRDNDRLQRELARQQTLVRAAQRTVGLSPPTPPPPKPGKKPRRRRPVARALNVAQRLRQEEVNLHPISAKVQESSQEQSQQPTV